MADHSEHLLLQVQKALGDCRQGDGNGLCIVGANSRLQFLAHAAGATLSVNAHSGVVDYQPDELMLRVRAGTPVADIKTLLDQHKQQLAADVPLLSANSTIGGAIATGWDGSGKFYGNSLRDSVLGCQMINGLGERVNFGGQVMKNVAGYDVSRLQVGAMGCLGLLLDVSLKLLPQPELSEHRSFDVAPPMLSGWWSRLQLLQPFVRAASYYQGRLHVKFGGRARALNSILSNLGGDTTNAPFSVWQQSLFSAPMIAAVYTPAAVSIVPPGCDFLIDWGGRRTFVASADHQQLRLSAASFGGMVRVMRGPVVNSVPVALRLWHQRIRTAFDPYGLFNSRLFEQHFSGNDNDAG